MKSEWIIQTIKVDLIHWLTELQDRSTLEQLQAFKNQQEEVLSDAHKAILDKRISFYESNPEQVLEWDNVMKELEKDL